jgi:ADP-ribose pyrophosphatase YjhB (NUDIX family)
MPKDTKIAIATVVFARKNGRLYALRVQRANTHKWNRKVMFGAAEKKQEGETNKQALLRGLREELFLQPGEIIKYKPITQNIVREESHGLTARFYAVEISYDRLLNLAEQINKKSQRFDEVCGARISGIRRLAKNPKVMQPHYRDSRLQIIEHLRREQSYRRV